ncbi:MAG: amino acid permease [Gammaproteobacteria bacterium]|nr:amino acid permease [Gammaproteobacteria bacterium]MDP6616254.1 amino acid permease [Gammaproteobacteria bacterium]MDP6695439.1 amino acid permease [Gammaproteobacteria bacterium]
MSNSDEGLLSHIRFRSATALVIANVIGAGVFTTTGFQAADLGNPTLILVLWFIGGLLAYCGALCFAELGAAMPAAGAEYVYLRETYGRAFGFMSAFVSLLAGFSAPIAAALKSLVRYVTAYFPSLNGDMEVLGRLTVNDLSGIALVWMLVAIHMRGNRGAIGFNDLVTLLKVGGIVAIILAAAAFGDGNIANFSYVSDVYTGLSSATTYTALATSLIFVMFCYSGWNAAAYVASEIVEPQKTLPKALLVGAGIVTVLYLLLNSVYFYGANVEELAGKVEVGLVASRQLFGEWGAGLVTLVLVVSLIASASAMTIAGPRVYFALGQDIKRFRRLTLTNDSGAPSNALLLQGIVASLIIVSGSVDQILSYAGFTLALMSALAVSCVIVLRFRRPDMQRPFRVWAYPLPPLFFLAVSFWTMYWAFQGRPVESTLALLTVAAGGGIFLSAALLRR